MKPKKFKSAAEKKAKKSLKKDWADLKKRAHHSHLSMRWRSAASGFPFSSWRA